MVETDEVPTVPKKLWNQTRRLLRSRPKASKGDEPDASSAAGPALKGDDAGAVATDSPDIASPDARKGSEGELRIVQESHHEEASDQATPNANVDTSSYQSPISEAPDIFAGDSEIVREFQVAAPPKSALPLEHEVAARLWDIAYEDLAAEHPKLLESYERSLSIYLMQEDRGGFTPRRDSAYQLPQNEIDQADRPARREQMNQILDFWLSKANEGNSINVEDEETFQKASTLRDIMEKAMKGSRHAVLPWVMLCISAEVG